MNLNSLGMVGWGINWGSLVDRGSMSISLLWLWWVDWSSFIGDFSNESIVVVGCVGGGLDSAIRKSNHERSGNLSFSILGLSLLEVVLGIVINNTVFIGKWLRGKFLLLVDRGWVVWCRSSISWRGSSIGCSNESGGKNKLVHCS